MRGMSIGQRFRKLRKQKGMTQRNIQRTTGLLVQYISRVENDRVTPSLDTLSKMAMALAIPLYRLLYNDGGVLPAHIRRRLGGQVIKPTGKGRPDRYITGVLRLVPRIKASRRRLLLLTAMQLWRRTRDAGRAA